MASDDKVKIGIMSFAHMHAHSYTAYLMGMDSVKVIGLADDDKKRGRAMSKEFKIKAFDNCKKLLKEDIEAVVICSENSKHAELAIMAAEAKKHILCEKPISTNIKDAQKMIEACKKNGVKLMLAFPCRYLTSVTRARRIIENGEIGRILAIKGTNHGSFPGGWFTEAKKSGGGAIMDHTVHVVDLMRWILNKEVKRVYAEIDKSIHNKKIDDCGTLAFEFHGGVIATLDPSWSRPKSYMTWGDVTLDIIGEKGVIHVDAFAQAINVFDDAKNKHYWANWGSNADLKMLRSFIDMIRYNKEPAISGFDGLKAMEVALGAYESAKKKQAVELPLK